MTTFAVLAPLLAQVFITFLLMFGMVITRRRAVMDKQVDPKDLALRGANPWPRQAAQFGDAYQNSLELPVVFYALVIVAFVTKEADVVFVVLSWIFVLCRIVQAYVHTTSNIRKYRSLAFRGGAAVLFIMLIWLTVHISLI
ncbi:MAG TPA: MAPEG family protein [Xanthobacteraceae bacterium]|nr:MAPEG family protein [Xanthobacteraceae bacterium]